MTRDAQPLDYWKSGFDLWMRAAETQSVVAMRMMTMSGLLPTFSTQNARSFGQQPEDFGRAMMAATLAAASGGRPDQILNSTTKPVRPKTRHHTKILDQSGPAPTTPPPAG